MKLDRETWRARWEEDYPSPPCPTCGAPLNWEEAAVADRTPTHNLELVGLAGIEEAESRFAGWLVCGHAKCGEAVVVLGKCTYRYGYGDDGATVTRRILHPIAMYPPPPVIATAEEVPDRIRAVLSVSFGLFWTNRESCAGRLRVVVELILEHWGFPAEPSPGKFVALDKRIDDWTARYGATSIATSLKAIKWLGNVGAHETEVSRDRLLDAYEILDRLLKRMFPADDGYLDELADEMVRTRGR